MCTAPFDAGQSWAWNYAAALPGLGYPTCTVALPDAALGDIQVASGYVVFTVDTMSARWQSQVEVIGHSQGGIEPRSALRWWPGLRRKVDHYIGIASPDHGIYAADACAASGEPRGPLSRDDPDLNSSAHSTA